MKKIFRGKALRAWLMLIGAVAALAVFLPARAEVTLNLKDADINTLIQTVSDVTGKNFIVDPRVKGKVTVISSSPMDSRGVYETFLAVLQVQGFAAIPAGDTIKIVPETNARMDGGVRESNGAGLAVDEIVTHVYAIQNVSAAQLVPILRPLIPQWGHLAAYAPSNMLIISDHAANVQRIEKLIRQIDQTGDRGIETVALKNAAAAEVVRILTQLNQGEKQQAAAPDAGGTRPIAIVADERSNSVLIAGDRAERQKVIDIIAQIDVAVADGGATQVIYLHYASAENLAPILEGYAQQVSQPAAGGKAPSTPQSAPTGGTNADGVRVLADKDTNALIITAPPKTMRQIRDVIAQLDIQRAQVLVEGIIAEISAGKSGQLGIDWAVFNENRIAAAGLLNPATSQAIQSAGQLVGSSATSSSVSNSTALTAAALGLVGNGVTAAGGKINSNGTSFAILLKAIKGDTDSNVLSTPTIVTLDNEEAEISVGQEVPFLTGSFSNTGATGGSSVNPFQTIERKDVGLTLGITPQINEGNNIKLKIKLEVSSLTGAATSAVDLVTNKRTLTNTVSVEDGQVLVIGGLIDDNDTNSQQGVPFLSSIPVIGSLFRYRSVNRTKRNLMVFIKPAILRKQSDGDYYSRIKYEALRKLQLGNQEHGSVPIIGGSHALLEPFDRIVTPSANATPAPADQPPQVTPPPPVQLPPPLNVTPPPEPVQVPNASQLPTQDPGALTAPAVVQPSSPPAAAQPTPLPPPGGSTAPAEPVPIQ